MSSKSNDTHDESVLINIIPDAVRVCVCRVPKSLRCGKPEAFIPHFVGLGPYHHTRYELTMTDGLKKDAARRILEHAFEIRVSDIEPFYHKDAFNSSYYKGDTLLHDKLLDDMTLDGFFLLALLHRSVHHEPQQQHYSYFLTGKHGMPLVNAFGLELTMDAIIRDVFMLENQIPTRVLHQINQVSSKDEIQLPQQDLGAKMKSFCEKHCPLVNFEKHFSKKPEEHDHLLDLMYHLVAPEPDPEDKDGEGNKDSAQRPDESETKTEPKINACCFICINIIVFLVVFVVVFGFAVYLIWQLFLWVLRKIFYVVKKVSLQFVKLSNFVLPLVDGSCCDIPPLKPLFQKCKQTSEKIEREYSTDREKDARPAVTIASVTQLNGAGIQFEPANGGIKDLQFNAQTSQFFLPVIKLDVNSEVIIRNLVAYESLTRPTHLIFTRFVEIIRAIIDTPEDVKLLVHKKIIETKLSDQFVTDLFNGMSKSIRPTNTPKLEEEIKKVNAKFDRSQWLQRVMTNYVYPSWKLMTVVAALVFLVLTAVQTYCSIYVCSSPPSSKFGKLPGDWDYGINNDFISSM